MLDQTFIRVYNSGRGYDRDIKYATEHERRSWYDSLTKQELIELVEKLGGFNSVNK